MTLRILFHRVALRLQLAGAYDRKAVSDEFLRILERWIVGRHLHLREDRHDVRRAPRFPQRIFQRLLEHVPDPPGGSRNENAEWQRRDFAPRLLVSVELVANLRAIAMHDYHSPTVQHEIYDRPETLARVAKLIRDGRGFSGR
jgi:hypothetical protein